ncbi:MAG: hypothetical protein MUW56_09470 [Chryseobacterium sp.]|uniref:hypothetical protein n=1 Tax=Chryseobacterium sp. TaxID=1871047 RepID=UPI0025B8605D|nr:hypothetical protein [Chryseobacterium sp.]MCJ7933846.1 hypothetical protein [Chryseobacterium sp.]
MQFEIGEEACKREFDIIPIPPFDFIENNLSLEPHEFFGQIDNLFDLKISASVILFYNADILMRVKYKIRKNVVNILIKKIEESNLLIPKEISLMVAYDKNITIFKYESIQLHQLQ